jgi:hypothetical protein
VLRSFSNLRSDLVLSRRRRGFKSRRGRQFNGLGKICLLRALEIQEDEMPAVDAFVSKSEGIVAVVAEIAKFAQVWPANSAFLAIENNALSGAVH